MASIIQGQSELRIRGAGIADKDFVLDLSPRLIEFGEVPGRERSTMIARDRSVLLQALECPSTDNTVFVAEDGHGRLVGFIYLTTVADYYTDSPTAHIADIAVLAPESGRGIGTGLIRFADAWARERGYAMLTLNVFTANARARALYSRLGFAEESIRCVKHLPG